MLHNKMKEGNNVVPENGTDRAVIRDPVPSAIYLGLASTRAVAFLSRSAPAADQYRQAAFRAVSDFLRGALEGEDIFRRNRFQSTSPAYLDAYELGLQACEGILHKRGQEVTADNVKRCLIDISRLAQSLSEGRQIDREDRRVLRTFLTSIRDMTHAAKDATPEEVIVRKIIG